MEKDRIFSAAHSCYDPNRHAACSKLLDQERSYKQELTPQSSIRNNTQMTGGVYTSDLITQDSIEQVTYLKEIR